MLLDKPLPTNIGAEKEFLSMILKDNDILAEAIGQLRPGDFSIKPHFVIYKKLLQMYSKNIPIDLTTVANSFGTEILQSIGGVTYLSELYTAAISTAGFKQYIRIIKDLSNKRKIIKSCIEAVENAYEKDAETKNIIDKLENCFISMNEYEQESTINSYELMDSTINLIEENYKNGGRITGISTGYKPLDNAINGLIKQDLVLIAARPSMGKTALTMNIISNIPKEYNVMLFELEMSKEKLGIRMLAPKALINPQNLARGKIRDRDFAVITTKANEIVSKNNFFLNCKSGLSLGEIRAEAKKIKIKHGLDVIFIDHIGKIKPNNPRASRNDQIGQISEGLKNLAKDLDVCVVALSQLNRDCEKRPDKHPQLSDLRDSGNLEQDADSILFLYRDDYYADRENRDSEKPGVLEIMVAKNRDGEVGLLELTYNTDYQIITEKPY